MLGQLVNAILYCPNSLMTLNILKELSNRPVERASEHPGKRSRDQIKYIGDPKQFLSKNNWYGFILILVNHNISINITKASILNIT